MLRSIARRVISPPLHRELIPRFSRCRFLSSYPPHDVVGLPSLSPTMESGSIAAWNLKPGDSFRAGDVYCSVETDKATMDFEAQDDGVLAKILVAANSGDINVGVPIMITVQDKAHVAAFQNYLLDGAGGKPTTGTTIATAAVTAASPEVVTTPAAKEEASAGPAVAAAPFPGGDRVVASPLARMLAQEKGIDIAQVLGTGPGGRIIAADVKEYQPPKALTSATTMAGGSTATTSSTTTTATISSSPTPFSTTTTTTAMHWAQSSKQNVPHYYLTVDINIDNLQQLRTTVWSNSTPPVSLHACLIKAMALSMKTVPAVNAAYLGDTTRYYENVDIQVIGDTNIVVKNCANLGISAIESIVTDDTKADATAVGTFSFCNLGLYGISSCAPIIRPPQACALAVGAAETILVPSNGDIPYKTITQLTATLSCDHRVVDGAVGAQWLATFKNYVENPTTLLL